MGKKNRTPAQLAADKARSEKMKAKLAETISVAEAPEQIAEEQGMDELRAQVKLLTSLFASGGQSQGSVEKGRFIGEVDKYVVDPANYPDPTPRLKAEKRLLAVNFLYNYELDYEVSISSYETKTGINMREPKFTIQLNRIKLDDQGAQTNGRVRLRKLIFHEDPQAALVVAREKGLAVDDNQKEFLDEMRYLRVKDWLFDVFWPKPAQPQEQIREEVIAGTIFQTFEKSSVEADGIDFDKLNSKL
jgi:hypothetical protein